MKISNDDFIVALTTLKDDPMALLGLAMLMGLSLKNEKGDPKEAEDIISEMIITYDGFSRERRCTIMKILTGKYKRKVPKKRDDGQ